MLCESLPRTLSNRSCEAARPEVFPQELSTGLVHLLEPLNRLRVRALIHILREANSRRGQRGPREDTTPSIGGHVEHSCALQPAVSDLRAVRGGRPAAEAGIEPLPDGLEYHVCFGPEGNLRVSEIWDSREQFEAYGKRLMEMPVFADIPFDSGGPPEILEVHKIRKR